MASEWMRHNGGPSPVDFDKDRKVDVRRRDGTEARQYSIASGWFHQGWDDDVIEYRRIAG